MHTYVHQLVRTKSYLKLPHQLSERDISNQQLQAKAGQTVEAMNKLHDNLHLDFALLMQLQNVILQEVRRYFVPGSARVRGLLARLSCTAC